MSVFFGPPLTASESNSHATLPAVRNSIPDVAKQSDMEPYDYVVVTTKNIADIGPSVSEIIAPAVLPGHTTIALVQNGLNIERPVTDAFPSNPVISGVSFIGATEDPKGTIKHDDHDVLIVSRLRQPRHLPRDIRCSGQTVRGAVRELSGH